jgi:hypothetical protein
VLLVHVILDEWTEGDWRHLQHIVCGYRSVLPLSLFLPQPSTVCRGNTAPMFQICTQETWRLIVSSTSVTTSDPERKHRVRRVASGYLGPFILSCIHRLMHVAVPARQTFFSSVFIHTCISSRFNRFLHNAARSGSVRHSLRQYLSDTLRVRACACRTVWTGLSRVHTHPSALPSCFLGNFIAFSYHRFDFLPMSH